MILSRQNGMFVAAGEGVTALSQPYGHPMNWVSGSVGFGTTPYTISQTASTTSQVNSTKFLAWVCQSPRSGTITAVKFTALVITTTGTITAHLHDLDITNGSPGTIVDTGTVSVSALGVYEITFSTGKVVGVGDYFAISFSSTTADIRLAITGAGSGVTTMPYGLTSPDQTTWTRQTALNAVIITKIGGVWVLPTSSASLAMLEGRYSFNNSGEPREVGIDITTPFKARAIGVIMAIDPNVDAVVTVHSANGSFSDVVVDIDKDIVFNTSGQTVKYLFSSPITIVAGDTISITVFSSATGTSKVLLGQLNYADNNEKAVFINPNNTTVGKSRDSGGVWTDTPLQLPAISLLIDTIYHSTNTVKL